MKRYRKHLKKKKKYFDCRHLKFKKLILELLSTRARTATTSSWQSFLMTYQNMTEKKNNCKNNDNKRSHRSRYIHGNNLKYFMIVVNFKSQYPAAVKRRQKRDTKSILQLFFQ